jgi:hypothetical protein
MAPVPNTAAIMNSLPVIIKVMKPKS